MTNDPNPGYVGPETPPIIPGYVPPVVITTGTGSISRAPQNTLENVSRDAYETRLNVAAIDEPIRIVFGRVALGASLARTLKAGNNALIILLWCRGEIDAIESITMGGVALPSGATVTHYTGTASQTVNAAMVSAFASIGVTWTNALTGLAYSVVNLPPADSSGNLVSIGDFVATVRGLKCYDPRDGAQSYALPATWLYTTNPTLHTARLLYDDTLGLGMTPTSEFWADVTTNANKNDVALAGGEKTRELNIAIEAQQPAESWIKAMGEYAGCFVVPEGSIYRLIPDAIGSSVATIVTDDIVDGSFSWGKKTQRNRPNLVFVRYTDGVGGVPSIAPRGSDIPALPSGEKRRGTVVPMPGLIKYSQALRYSIERRNHLYLEDLELESTIFDRGLALQMGDIITVTYGALFTSKLMRIMSIAFVSVGRWRLKLDEYDPASYSTLVQTAPTYVDSGLALPTAPPTVASLTLTESSVSTGNAFTTSLQLVWPAVVWPFLKDYRVMIYDEGTLIQDSATTAAGFTSQPVAIGHNYRAFVYVRSTVAQGAGVMRSITVSGSAAAAQGEMLWAAYPIEPNSTYEPKAFQRGLGDPQRHSYVTAFAYGPGGIFYRGPSWFLPDMASIGPIEEEVRTITTGGPAPVYGGDFTLPPPDADIGWQSDVITLFGGAHRVCRLAVALDVRTVKHTDMLVGTVFAPWVNGTHEASRTTYGGAVAGDLESVEVTLEQLGTYGAALVDTPGTLYVYTPTANEDQTVTSSASGALTVMCANNYAKLKGLPKVTPLTTAARYPTIENVTYGAVCTFELRIFNEAGALTATPCSITIEGTI